jgi:heme-degrading monooxygenase HmoA
VYARLAKYEVPPDNVDVAIDGFREAGAVLQDLDGMIGGYLLVDEESGETISITLWDNQVAMAGSGTQAASLRQAALREANGAVVSVAEYQVAVEFGGSTRVVIDEEAS